MNIQLAYKFKDGTTALSPACDSYQFSNPNSGDFLKLSVKGKMDNKDIEVNGIKFKYNDLNSIEIIFID